MMITPAIHLGHRRVSGNDPPLVNAEIGINHEGNYQKAKRMVDDAYAAGCECVKFQCHVIEDEMIQNDVVPGNASSTPVSVRVRNWLREWASAQVDDGKEGGRGNRMSEIAIRAEGLSKRYRIDAEQKVYKAPRRAGLALPQCCAVKGKTTPW
jgi:hypothetical protein